MTLRSRLVLTIVALLMLGLGAALGGTFGAIADWKSNRNHEVLASVGDSLDRALREDEGVLADAPPPGGEQPEEDGATRAGDQDAAVLPLWRAAALTGEAPSFLQLRDADGAVLRTVVHGPQPDLPDRLPAEMRPHPVESGDGGDGERFLAVGTAPGTDGTGEDSGWLVRTAQLRDTSRADGDGSEGGEILVVAMRTAASDELTGRAARAAITSAVVVLAAVTLLSLRVVRRGLRPLEDVAETAGAIGAGDLSRRVPQAGEKTEVGRLNSALNAMLGQIEAAFRERQASEDRLRRFVADASHELRTPVATIRGYAELFRRGAADRPADLATSMSRIEAEASRMGALVDELLLLARLDQGRPLEREPVELGTLGAEMADDARAAAPERELATDLPGPVWVEGDDARLRQLVGNLLANVRQHTPPGTAAELRIRPEGDEVVVEVADRGPGVPPDRAGQVFERFYRVGTDRTPHQGGAGLGLSIVQAVTSAHRGSCGIRPTDGGGATFWVRLPRHRPVSAPDGTRDPEP